MGDRVAALTGHGGYTEMIYLGQEHLVPVPPSLDPAEVAVVVLNYVTAYQMLHRVAKVKAGDKVLLIGASGGVGTALLQLGRLAGLKMYGTASPGKAKLLTEMGAIPIDYHSQDFVEVIRQAEPGGLDFVFDGMGGEYGDRGYGGAAAGRQAGGLCRAHRAGGAAARRGQAGLGQPAAQWQDRRILWHYHPVYAGQAAVYGRSAVLLSLLAEGKIKPVITQKFSILEAAKANALLESGKITGNIVLLVAQICYNIKTVIGLRPMCFGVLFRIFTLS